MFHTLVGIFQLELFILITYFFYPSQEAKETTRPVENIERRTGKKTTCEWGDGEK